MYSIQGSLVGHMAIINGQVCDLIKLRKWPYCALPLHSPTHPHTHTHTLINTQSDRDCEPLGGEKHEVCGCVTHTHTMGRCWGLFYKLPVCQV